MTHAINTCLKSLRLGTPAQAMNLSVFPLLDGSKGANGGYLTMDHALKAGVLRVTEIDATGSVPELKVNNLAGKPVLLLDGEELVGALQNRVLNITILVPPKTEIVVPVSCVEMGRWSLRSPRFFAGERTMYAQGRARKTVEVNHSLRQLGSRRSDQHAVWQDIDRKAAAMEVCCETSAMSDIYAGTQDRRQAYRLIGCPADARGAVFCIDGKPVGMEVLDSQASFALLFSKLLDSYAMDALEAHTRRQVLPERSSAQVLIDATCTANSERFPALGMGEDVRLESVIVVGGGLTVNDQLVQLSAFSRPIDRGYRDSRDHRFERVLRSQHSNQTESNNPEARRDLLARFLLEEV